MRPVGCRGHRSGGRLSFGSLSLGVQVYSSGKGLKGGSYEPDSLVKMLTISGERRWQGQEKRCQQPTRLMVYSLGIKRHGVLSICSQRQSNWPVLASVVEQGVYSILLSASPHAGYERTARAGSVPTQAQVGFKAQSRKEKDGLRTPLHLA